MEKPYHRFGAAAAVEAIEQGLGPAGGALGLPLVEAADDLAPCEIRLQGICKSFGRTEVLREVSLTVASGQFVTILGPSGCGKTTLLRIVAGLEPLLPQRPRTGPRRGGTRRHPERGAGPPVNQLRTGREGGRPAIQLPVARHAQRGQGGAVRVPENSFRFLLTLGGKSLYFAHLKLWVQEVPSGKK